MKFLIPTEPDDTQAIMVKLALQSMDHDVHCLMTADFPTRQTHSVTIEHRHLEWTRSDAYESLTENHYDVVWWRRPRQPYLPAHLVHTHDYAFSQRENRLFFESLSDVVAPQAWWVNPKIAAKRVNSKVLQLRAATQCGMQIPNTLCSNDPIDIRYFILKHERQGVIYKALSPQCWYEEQVVKVAYTSKVTFNQLPSNQTLQFTPGIYQQEIPKKYELRITAFGDHLVAVKINSQVHQGGKTDWRAVSRELTIEPYVLPHKLTQQIQLFMRKMHIVFGAFDFIVTPDDSYIFLEVNEQGQFLWAEECNPDIKMLDPFIQFLCHRRHAFTWQEHQLQHHVENYQSLLGPIYDANLRRHVDLNDFRMNQPSQPALSSIGHAR